MAFPSPSEEDGTPQPEWSAAFFEAGKSFRLRLIAERTRGLAIGSPDWRLFAFTLADEDILPAALAALGYRHRVTTDFDAPSWWPDAAAPILSMAEVAEAPAVVAVEFWLGRWSFLPECGVRGADLLESV